MKYLGNSPPLDITTYDAERYDYVFYGYPTDSVNPSCLYATWLNASTGEVFVCRDNTVDANVWVSQQGQTIPQGNGVYLNGTDAYVNLGLSRIPTSTNFWTVEIDFQYISDGGIGYVFSQYTSAATGRALIYTQGGNLFWLTSYSGAASLGSVSTSRQTFAANSDSSAYRCYLNGVYNLTDTPTGSILAQNTLVGSGYDTDGTSLINFCEMNIYAVRIWESKLEGATLLPIYNNGGITYPCPALLHHWTFFEGSGTTTKDHVTGGDATLVNCSWI